jgi:hypothetical protein
MSQKLLKMQIFNKRIYDWTIEGLQIELFDCRLTIDSATNRQS